MPVSAYPAGKAWLCRAYPVDTRAKALEVDVRSIVPAQPVSEQSGPLGSEKAQATVSVHG